MNITPRQYAVSLYESLKDEKNAEEVGRKILNFAKLLRKNNDLRQKNKIIAEFKKYWNKERGIVGVAVKSARPLTEKEKEGIKKKFASKEVELKEKIDKSLIGGMVLKIGDTIIDGSVKGLLQNLKFILR